MVAPVTDAPAAGMPSAPSALSALALPAPDRPDPAQVPGLRWGVLGAGGIAGAMVAALRGTRQQVVAVGSRDLGRARAFVARHVGGGATPFGRYEDLVADDRVEVVYVATPHSEHLQHARLALAAGKHVLVEKAFTADAAQARELVAAAHAADRFCMEAMWSRFLPS